jgi:hypothetical protein
MVGVVSSTKATPPPAGSRVWRRAQRRGSSGSGTGVDHDPVPTCSTGERTVPAHACPRTGSVAMTTPARYTLSPSRTDGSAIAPPDEATASFGGRPGRPAQILVPEPSDA